MSNFLQKINIEVGKRLTQAKAKLQHGQWLNWLESNFSLSQPMANNFMRVAERFGNSATSQNLKQSQMMEMLLLPESETEKFIAEKSAEGTPVEDMTVKKLREEITSWKAKADNEKAKVENLSAELRKEKTHSEHNALLLRNQNQAIKQLQQDNGRLQAKFDALQNQLITDSYYKE